MIYGNVTSRHIERRPGWHCQGAHRVLSPSYSLRGASSLLSIPSTCISFWPEIPTVRRWFHQHLGSQRRMASGNECALRNLGRNYSSSSIRAHNQWFAIQEILISRHIRKKIRSEKTIFVQEILENIRKSGILYIYNRLNFYLRLLRSPFGILGHFRKLSILTKCCTHTELGSR